MKTVKIISIAAVALTIVFSCKTETEKSQNKDPEKELALTQTNTNPNFVAKTETYKYVIATTGLSLREYNNLNSKKLAIMPYGTRVKVLTPETKNTMTVSGIKGGMDEVAFNHKEGFAFNGYLSTYFPPEEDMNIHGYASELKTVFPDVTYSKIVGKSVRKPSVTETVTLPNAQWSEAFFIAKKIGNIPAYFAFPSTRGNKNQVLSEPDSKDKPWTSELRITRDQNTIKTIKYYYKNKNVTSIITLTKEGTVMKISKTEVVE